MAICAVIIGAAVVNVIIANCGADQIQGTQLRTVPPSERVGPGDTFDGGGFIEPQPFPSWTLTGRRWHPPTPKPPQPGYRWDEPTLAWVFVGEPGQPPPGNGGGMGFRPR